MPKNLIGGKHKHLNKKRKEKQFNETEELFYGLIINVLGNNQFIIIDKNNKEYRGKLCGKIRSKKNDILKNNFCQSSKRDWETTTDKLSNVDIVEIYNDFEKDRIVQNLPEIECYLDTFRFKNESDFIDEDLINTLDCS